MRFPNKKRESLSDLVLASLAKKVAVVGMSKNVGKTVTFNYLSKALYNHGLRQGILSAGRDGEPYDLLTLKEKPRIIAWKGLLVATAEPCFYNGEAELSLLERSGIYTAMGEVLLGKAKTAGKVELAGPGSLQDTKKLLNRLIKIGAKQLLIDGAINRIASASPQIADGIILATGASLAPTMNSVIEKLLFRCELFRLPELNAVKVLPAGTRKHLTTTKERFMLLKRDGAKITREFLPGETSLMASRNLKERLGAEVLLVAPGGALVEQILLDITTASLSKMPLVLVEDATKIFISPSLYYRFKYRGGKILVRKKINLLAVTINPHNPTGNSFEPADFLKKTQEALAPLPVYDLVYEKLSTPQQAFD